MNMVFFRSRQDHNQIGWSYYFEELDEMQWISNYHVGDDVAILFYLEQQVVDALRSRVDIGNKWSENTLLNPEEEDRYHVRLDFRVVNRSHALCHFKRLSGSFVESQHSIALEPVTDEDEQALLTLFELDPPKWTRLI